MNYNCYVHKSHSYSNTTASIQLIPDTISELLNKVADKSPSKIGYIFPHNGANGVELTFEELKKKVDKLADNLLKLGLTKGDIIAFSLPNTHELLILFFASAKIGLISLFIEPLNQKMEFEYYLKKTRAKALVYCDLCPFGNKKQYEIVNSICLNVKGSQNKIIKSDQMPDLKRLIYLQGPEKMILPDFIIPYEELFTDTKENFIYPLVNSDDPAVIMFTSGTTGLRKGVLMSQFSIINLGHMFGHVPNESVNKTWIKTLCNQFQMYHASNLHSGIITPLVCNNQVVFPAYIANIESTLKALEKYKCNSLFASTKHIELIFAYDNLKSYNLENLEYISSAATPMNPKLIEKFKKENGIKAYVSNYGMTEMCGTALMTLISDQTISNDYAHKSLGRPFPFFEAKVVNLTNGKIQPHNESGELYLRSFSSMIGYFEEKEMTKEIKNEYGWLKTGDEVYMNHDGYIFYINRSKDAIHGQFKIYPSEVEYCIKSHSDVENAVVFGISTSINFEETCAWVKLKNESSSLTVDELKRYCHENIASFKVPKHIKFVNDFPFNATGKFVRRTIIDVYRKELGL